MTWLWIVAIAVTVTLLSLVMLSLVGRRLRRFEREDDQAWPSERGL